jgi:hypothetical protein
LIGLVLVTANDDSSVETSDDFSDSESDEYVAPVIIREDSTSLESTGDAPDEESSYTATGLSTNAGDIEPEVCNQAEWRECRLVLPSSECGDHDAYKTIAKTIYNNYQDYAVCL